MDSMQSATSGKTSGKTARNGYAGFEERTEAVKEYLTTHDDSGSSEIAKYSGLSPQHTRTLLKRMCNLEMISSLRNDKKRRYRLKQ